MHSSAVVRLFVIAGSFLDNIGTNLLIHVLLTTALVLDVRNCRFVFGTYTDVGYGVYGPTYVAHFVFCSKPVNAIKTTIHRYFVALPLKDLCTSLPVGGIGPINHAINNIISSYFQPPYFTATSPLYPLLPPTLIFFLIFLLFLLLFHESGQQ